MSASHPLRVFISYARTDRTFVDGLVLGLKVASFDAYRDVKDLVAGEDWREALLGMIQSADTVIYVMSRDSLASPTCDWELTQAASLGKRIVQILSPGTTPEDIPASKKKFDYVDFTNAELNLQSLARLVDALRTDSDWVSRHTWLGDNARKWDADKDVTLLLRDNELDAALRWQTEWRTPLPEPTRLQLSYIRASEEQREEDARGREKDATWSFSVLLLAPATIVFTVIAIYILNKSRVPPLDGGSILIEFARLLQAQFIMDAIAAGVFGVGILFVVGFWRLRKSLGLPHIAGIALIMLAAATLTYLTVGAIATHAVIQANYLDDQATAGNFDVSLHAPDFRCLLDRWRDVAPEGCEPGERGEVQNVWQQRMGPYFFIPLVILFLTPILLVGVVRLVRGHPKREAKASA